MGEVVPIILGGSEYAFRPVTKASQQPDGGAVVARYKATVVIRRDIGRNGATENLKTFLEMAWHGEQNWSM